MKHLLLITTFLGLLLLGINGCGNKEQKDFSEYISGYTSGMVTAESPIYIYLAKPADKSFQAGSVLPAKLVNFTPAVKGECMLKDEHTVMFTPETPLKNAWSRPKRIYLPKKRPKNIVTKKKMSIFARLYWFKYFGLKG